MNQDNPRIPRLIVMALITQLELPQEPCKWTRAELLEFSESVFKLAGVCFRGETMTKGDSEWAVDFFKKGILSPVEDSFVDLWQALLALYDDSEELVALNYRRDEVSRLLKLARRENHD